MNIAILGARFDPPHVWHFLVAQQILENISTIDQVWLLPDYRNAFKPIIALPSDRVEMLHFLETGRIKLSTIAIARETITYTVEIAAQLKKDPNNKYFWVIGSDAASEISRWRDYRKLTKMIEFLVFPRKDFPIKTLPQGFSKVPGELLLSNVSSTIIRQHVREGLSITGLVFPEVEDYIRRRNLYR